jgi:hypothetical protein
VLFVGKSAIAAVLTWQRQADLLVRTISVSKSRDW